MFGLTFEKLLIIGVIAVFLIGPQKLPLYAQKLGALVRAVRDFTDTAKARVAEELGPELDPSDWKKLDPRQYDPRRIVREALAEGSSPAPAPAAVVRRPARGVEATPATPATTVAPTEAMPATAPTPVTAAATPAHTVAPGGWQEALLARVGTTPGQTPAPATTPAPAPRSSLG